MDCSFISKISKVGFNRIEEMISSTITDIIEVRRRRDNNCVSFRTKSDVHVLST
jgi:hypothetical protein